ncbi:MAG: hypothetical protein GX605_06595 [Chloroflexi bacterium]|nr:hypothetical protein [Chloroflexota bacterium]
MLPRFREILRPLQVEEAVALLQRPGIRSAALAGGTSLLQSPDPAIEAVIDLQALPLQEVQATPQGLRLGAMVRLQRLIDHPAAEPFAGGLLAEAARRSKPQTLRQAATVGGCAAAAESADALLLALLALKAQLTLHRPQPTSLPLAAFLPQREALLSQGALLTELTLPWPAPRSGAALHAVARTSADGPIVMAAAAMTLAPNGAVQTARVLVGGLTPQPLPLPQVQATLVGRAPDDRAIREAAAHLSVPHPPLSDARASGDYRLAVAPVAVRRALHLAAQRAQG